MRLRHGPGRRRVRDGCGQAAPNDAGVPAHALGRANHNYYNQTLVALRKDDADSQKGRCAKPNRLTGPAQQAFLARVVTDHFGSWMLDAPPAAWITGPVQGSLYGQKVAIKRVTP